MLSGVNPKITMIIDIYIVQIPCKMIKIMRVTDKYDTIKHNKLRIPTGGRLTSWLFTGRGGVEFGATEDKSI